MSVNTDPAQNEPTANRPAARAGLLQVAGIVLSGLFMIGRRKTWNNEGVRVTPAQIVVGALIGGIVLIATLLTLVRLVLALATGQ